MGVLRCFFLLSYVSNLDSRCLKQQRSMHPRVCFRLAS